MVGTSSAMVLGFSTLMALVFVLAAAPISQGLFGNTDYQGLVRLVALVQMGIAWGNLLLALMKGFRDAAGNALSLIVGTEEGPRSARRELGMGVQEEPKSKAEAEELVSCTGHPRDIPEDGFLC